MCVSSSSLIFGEGGAAVGENNGGASAFIPSFRGLAGASPSIHAHPPPTRSFSHKLCILIYLSPSRLPVDLQPRVTGRSAGGGGRTSVAADLWS